MLALLIREAIRLTLLEPDNKEYQDFLTGLLDVYRKAKHFADDQRLGVNGWQSRVAELFDDLAGLYVARSGIQAEQKAVSSDETDCEFDNLVQEITWLMCDSELFTFMLHPEADGTNNAAERSLRGAAQDRRTGRTSKTFRGAQRRTILMSVLESLKLHLPTFTLASVQSEVQSWWRHGESLFSRMLRECGLEPPDNSKLDKLVPLPNFS